jgi:hypothetical protein
VPTPGWNQHPCWGSVVPRAWGRTSRFVPPLRPQPQTTVNRGPTSASREPGPLCPPAARSSAQNHPPGPPTTSAGTFPVGLRWTSPRLTPRDCPTRRASDNPKSRATPKATHQCRPVREPGFTTHRNLPPHGKTVAAPYSRLGPHHRFAPTSPRPPTQNISSPLSLVSSLGRRPPDTTRQLASRRCFSHPPRSSIILTSIPLDGARCGCPHLTGGTRGDCEDTTLMKGIRIHRDFSPATLRLHWEVGGFRHHNHASEGLRQGVAGDRAGRIHRGKTMHHRRCVSRSSDGGHREACRGGWST